MQVGYAYASRFQHVKLLHILSSDSDQHALAIMCTGGRAIEKPDTGVERRVTCDKCKAAVTRRRGKIVVAA